MSTKIKEKSSIIGSLKTFEKRTLCILFSDEKLFDLDGVYNSHNERIWVESRLETDEKDRIKRKQMFPSKGHSLAGCLHQRSKVISHF